MTSHELLEYCLKKPGAYECYPFGETPCCVKVGKRLFAQIYPDKATLNCTSEAGVFWREVYPGAVTRGYHCPPVQQPYFNTVALSGEVPDTELSAMADHSYRTVLAKLSKRERDAALQQDP